MTCRIVAVASARASILRVSLREDELVRSQVVSLVVDRNCGAIGVAEALGIPCTRIDEADNERFSDALLSHCREVGADHIALFFGRLLVGAVLTEYDHRIVNIHPSALPAFRGLRAFDQAWRSSARFTGTTVHFIDERVDEGQVILQSVLPIDRGRDPAELRHRQFEHMCKGFIQVCHWLEEGRIGIVDGRVEVAGAGFDQPDFSPALEAQSARQLVVPPPPEA